MLASMENYSNTTFRTLAHRHGTGLTFTEMSHIETINRNNRDTLEKILTKDNTLQIQIHKQHKKLDRLLTNFKTYPGFKGFNLNLSCPSRNIIRHGKGLLVTPRKHGAPGVIRLAIDLCYEYLEAGDKPDARVKASTEFLEGKLICKAKIAEKTIEARGGFDVGLMNLKSG